jgi:signal transduction histidine kinase
MILNDPFFIGICFFSIGFLTLVGFTSACLNYFFKSKIYSYYSVYILSLIIFIIAVYTKNTGDFPLKSERRYTMQLLVDGLQVWSSLLFCGFIYTAMILQDKKYKKLKKFYLLFIGFTVSYTIIMFLLPDFVRTNYPFFILSRTIIFSISLIFYYKIGKDLNIVFFRYLFLGITFLFLFGILALWDSAFRINKSIYTGFQYLCYGYFFENIFFIGAFIYKYFIVNKEKNEAAHLYDLQLISSKNEMQQQTLDYISREIHDNIGQKLTLASLYTQQLDHENNSVDTKDKIDNINSILNETLSEIRELTKSLIHNSIGDNIIYNLIKIECERIKKLNQFNVRLICNNKKINLSLEAKTILIRIVQEFFQNSIKHADCKNIIVSINDNNTIIELSLIDDGNGFDKDNLQSDGNGLKNMKTRTELLNGNFSLESKKNIGTKVTVTLPL